MSEAQVVEVPSSFTTVTSENSADFYAQKLGLAANDAPVEAAVEETPAEPTDANGESGQEGEEEAKATEEAKKPNPKLEKRFSELTKRRAEAEARAEAESKRASELEEKLKAMEAPKPQKAQDYEPEPQRDQFSSNIDYAKALAEWTADKAIQDYKKQEAEKQVQAERQRVYEAFNAKQQSFIAQTPDYQDMIQSSPTQVSDLVKEAIIESDVGPQILYHIASNEELGERFAKWSDAKALRELGKLEAMFEKAEPKEEEAKPVAQKSKAPAPIQPLKAASAAIDTPIGSDGQFHGTYAQWKAARKAGKVR